ncbi:MAG: GtrA family protein [Actinomycetota bacterium]|nr:GtrA family protein [Actinomycetota bacterium]
MKQRLPVRLLARLVRYAAVSAIATTVSLTILGVLVASGVTTAGWANVIATAVGTVPSFELNRRWVWGKSGRRSVGAEIGPFCVLSFAGLALSTVAVSTASGWATAAHLGVGGRTLVAEAANVATFGALWVAQYVILDRVLFRTGSRDAQTVHPPTQPAAQRAAGTEGAEGDRMSLQAA